MSTPSPYPWAAGFYPGDRAQVVTTRFQYEDAHTIDRYHATGGYRGLRKALEQTPADVSEEVKKSTLLGRGGAGFPAGTKWSFMPPGVWPRYLVVNGDESEPGTYKDRLLMECDPHQLIEGCLIACYAAGLSRCFLYIRGEMPLAHERVAKALDDAYAAGYVGKNILGTNFSVDIVMHYGAGAYVVGEETALIESLEGERGMPRLKPPYFPAAIGLYGKPTVVNNVETLSNLPFIALNGSAAFTAIGTETSPGTRMIAVSGHVKRPGVYEIVNGSTTFRDLIYGDDFAQGIRDGNDAQDVRARRWLGAVVPARPARHPVRGSRRGQRRLDARIGCGDGDGRHHRHPRRGADARAVLRPRVVRQVRAVPRGRHLAVPDRRADRRRRRHRRRSRHHPRGRRVDLPGGDAARRERAARTRLPFRSRTR